jgi:hypothetical protein
MRILLLSSAYNLHPGIVGDRGGNSLDWALQEMKNNFLGRGSQLSRGQNRFRSQAAARTSILRPR